MNSKQFEEIILHKLNSNWISICRNVFSFQFKTRKSQSMKIKFKKYSSNKMESTALNPTVQNYHWTYTTVQNCFCGCLNLTS